MESGKLRERITIESITETRGAQGDPINTYATFLSAWAEVTPLNGSEVFYGDRVEAIHDHAVKMRFRPGINPTMQVIHDGKTLNILSVKDFKDRHRTTLLLCKEKIPDA